MWFPVGAGLDQLINYKSSPHHERVLQISAVAGGSSVTADGMNTEKVMF